MGSQRKQPSEEQPPPDESCEQGNDQCVVTIELKPGESAGVKVSKDLGVMQITKTGPCDGKLIVGDVITHVS